MESQKKNTIIYHVGLPKTGTTTLQKYLFSKINTNINTHHYPQADYYNSFFKEEFLKYCLGGGSKPTIKLCDDRVNIISVDEIFRPHYIHKKKLSLYSSDSKVFDNIKELTENDFNETKVLIVIRNQQTLIPSYYLQNKFFFDSDENNNSIEKHLNFVFNNKHLFSSWYFNELLDLIGAKFERENLKVMMYEDLLFNSKSYYREIADFINLDYDFVMNTIGTEISNNRFSENGVKFKYRKFETSFGKKVSLLKKFLFSKGLKKLPVLESQKLQPFKKFFEKTFFYSERKFIVRDLKEEEKRAIFQHYVKSNEQLIGRYGLTEEKLKLYNYI